MLKLTNVHAQAFAALCAQLGTIYELEPLDFLITFDFINHLFSPASLHCRNLAYLVP